MTLVFVLAAALHAADEAPPWLKQLAAHQHPAYSSKTPAVSLLREEHTTVDANGRLTVRSRRAIKVLTKEGTREARGSEAYLTKTGKVRSMEGWLIRPNGEVKRYAKDRILDLAFTENDIYNEVRLRSISAAGDAEPGAVFGYEAELEDKSVFTQFQWDFQDDLPVLASRQLLTLAPGWEAKSVTFNHADVKPKMDGGAYIWELNTLPPIEDEPGRPAVRGLAPRVAITLLPPSSSSSRTINSWADVSRWMSELSDPQATPNDAITAKVRELTAGAATELDKIRPLAEYAQNINYVSIQTGVGRGGGYQPHAAAEVFAKSYGDCKDKANLLRTMLKVAGIESYPVSIYSGDRDYARPEWPSPHQFNHAILAIRVTEETKLPTVLNHATLGRLLFFDPTDPYTALGDLPESEQGSHALVSKGGDGALVRMPVVAAAENLRERRTEIKLAADGSIEAAIHETSRGQTASAERALQRRVNPAEYRAIHERFVGLGAPGSAIRKLEGTDKFREGRFDLDIELTAATYARSMRGALLIFRPCLLPRNDAISLREKTRTHPLVLDSQAFRETVHVAIPAGYAVDEMLPPVKLDTDFGLFEASGRVEEGKLIVERKLELKAITVPAARYDEVRKFLGLVNGWEQSSVVLARK